MIDSGNLPAPYPHPNNSSGTLKERNHLYLPLLTHYANIIPTFFAHVNPSFFYKKIEHPNELENTSKTPIPCTSKHPQNLPHKILISRKQHIPSRKNSLKILKSLQKPPQKPTSTNSHHPLKDHFYPHQILPIPLQLSAYPHQILPSRRQPSI